MAACVLISGDDVFYCVRVALNSALSSFRFQRSAHSSPGRVEGTPGIRRPLPCPGRRVELTVRHSRGRNRLTDDKSRNRNRVVKNIMFREKDSELEKMRSGGRNHGE